MLPLEPLERSEWSQTHTVRVYALRGYRVLAVVTPIVKATEIGLGH
jgi:hypothetical protein